MGQTATIKLSDGTNAFSTSVTSNTLTGAAVSKNGRLTLAPGATGRVTVGGVSGKELTVDSASGDLSVAGATTVAGTLHTAKLNIETALAVGTSGQTIDKATGILTSTATSLAASPGPVGGTVSDLPCDVRREGG